MSFRLFYCSLIASLITSSKDPYFIHFTATELPKVLPLHFDQVSEGKPHALCLLAAKELQVHLNNQQEWQHNFGLSNAIKGPIIGKMFGVLAVQNQEGEIGYLAAFSGKLAGSNHHRLFVPPVFDMLTENSFLNQGMLVLTRISEQIRELEKQKQSENESEERLKLLKAQRRAHSNSLQRQLFEHYCFWNELGEEKSLYSIFQEAGYKNPPAGAGECAGPKLLQYAFQHHLKPLAIAEFWWGQSPKSAYWKHGNFYPCCKEKCEPILKHMLTGINKHLA